jgi:hypothetical protein
LGPMYWLSLVSTRLHGVTSQNTVILPL